MKNHKRIMNGSELAEDKIVTQSDLLAAKA